MTNTSTLISPVCQEMHYECTGWQDLPYVGFQDSVQAFIKGS